MSSLISTKQVVSLDMKILENILTIHQNILMQSFVNLVDNSLPAKKIDVFGKGGLLMTSKPYYLLLLIMILAFQTVWTHAMILVVIIYVLLPFLDEVFSLDEVNPTEVQRKELEQNDFYFKICLFLTIIGDWLLFFKGMKYFSEFQFTISSTYNMVALLFIFSNLNAVQFAVAHEIFHKQGFFYRFLGTIHMSKNLYMHFTYEHLFGHHRKVATPEDPATSFYGTSVYQFFPKTFFGSYKSVYLMQKQEDHKPFYLNYAVLSVAAAIGFIYLIFYFYGLQTTIFFFIEAFFSIFYLEAINYIEHYGLMRQKLSNNEYEKVTIKHSWNAPHRFSNYILYKLQRHSDHHQNALKPYQTLVSLKESPHLPHGYSLMIIMSFFPSVWFSVMNPLVDEYKKINIGRVTNEVTLKSAELTRQFAIKLGAFVITIWMTGFFVSVFYG